MSCLSNDSKESVLEIGSSGFTRKQSLLAICPPAVASWGSIATYDTVAGNENGNPVGPTGVSHRTNGGGFAGVPGQLGVAQCLSGENLCQGLPNALLKRGAHQVERQIRWQG